LFRYSRSLNQMKKKKTHRKDEIGGVNTDVLKMYLMGAANPAHSNKVFNQVADVVDLHLDEPTANHHNIDPTEALFLQLQHAEKCLDAAIAARKTEFRIVHGIGSGKLKTEIHKMLSKHPHVVSFENAYHSRYGWGSTLVKLL